jgi:hypothetical protein
MQADSIEVSWYSGKSKWLVRIAVGEEVIRRYCDLPRDASEKDLRAVALQTLKDEGYEPDGVTVSIQPHAA